MMEYKRKTRLKFTNENCKPVYDKNGDIVMDRELFDLLCEEHNCLWEIENKIEQGKMIELPCKVGDRVYLPWLYCGVCGIAYLTVTHIILDTEKSYIKTNFETDIEDYYEEYKGGQYDFNDFGKIVFTNKAEAEKKLKELQNG